MNTFIVSRPEITLAGISVRTTNAEEMGAGGRLPQLWETYTHSDIAAQIGTSAPGLIYALYTDYESDETGAYTVLVGHEADSGAVRNTEWEGLQTRAVPAGRYRVFTTGQGPVYEAVAQAWMKIWEYFRDSEEVRTFAGDFELYDSGAADPTHGGVQIYIGIQ